MIVIIGNDPRGVLLPDLNDTVYYKQEKTYSEEQYNKSNDLRKALKKGKLTLLEEQKEPDAGYTIPASAEPSVVVKTVTQKLDDSVLSLLLEKITSLESTIKAQNTVEKSSEEKEALLNIQERLGKLEQRISSGPAPMQDPGLSEALKGIASKLEESQKNSDPSDKLNSILNRLEKRLDGQEEDSDMTPGEVYVPTVTVEDANAHIKLDVRTIESSDAVNDSLKALRALKNNK